MAISVLLVDDHELVRRGLHDLLDGEPDIHVVGEAGTADRARGLALALRPDVAVIDVRLADDDGVGLCRDIRNAVDPPPACLMFTAHSDDEALFAAIMAGADAYMLKNVSGNDLVTAVRTLAAGGSMLDPTVTTRVLDRMRSKPKPDPRYAALSPQERRILDLIAEGLTNRQIAARLFLAEKTVKNYISSLLHELGFSRRTEAGVYAVRRHRSEHGPRSD
jgi:DNA-binding NarL/FixJ family response regulator